MWLCKYTAFFSGIKGKYEKTVMSHICMRVTNMMNNGEFNICAPHLRNAGFKNILT